MCETKKIQVFDAKQERRIWEHNEVMRLNMMTLTQDDLLVKINDAKLGYSTMKVIDSIDDSDLTLTHHH
jgi:hypothetical protein